jgi:hypothetical protein
LRSPATNGHMGNSCRQPNQVINTLRPNACELFTHPSPAEPP